MLVFLWSAKVALSILGYVHKEFSAPVKNAYVSGCQWNSIVGEIYAFCAIDLKPCLYLVSKSESHCELTLDLSHCIMQLWIWTDTLDLLLISLTMSTNA